MASATGLGENVLLSSCTVTPYRCETILVNSRNGDVLWNAPYGGSDCSPTVGGGMVFVSETSDDAQTFTYGGVAIISVLNSSDGKMRWQYRSDVPTLPSYRVSGQYRERTGTASTTSRYRSRIS